MDDAFTAKACINCAFFVKEYIEDNTGRRTVHIMSESERSLVVCGNSDAVKDYYSYACHLGQWDEGVAGKIRTLWEPGAFLFKTTCNSFISIDAQKPGKVLSAYKSDLEHRKRMQDEESRKNSDQRHLQIARWSAVAATFAAVAAWGSVLVSLIKTSQ